MEKMKKKSLTVKSDENKIKNTLRSFRDFPPPVWAYCPWKREKDHNSLI
jgi:hypothetical protein